jgi:hypothetical protein
MFAFAQNFRSRWFLTPQERHNLRMSSTPLAVVSASLGCHPPLSRT